MKHRNNLQSTTSLPQAPEDEAGARLKRYAITMGVRTLCFLLMVFITPYGWQTWVFAAGAIFLPYVAVVFANTGSRDVTTRPERPARAIEASRDTSAAPPADERPTTITLHETPRQDGTG